MIVWWYELFSFLLRVVLKICTNVFILIQNLPVIPRPFVNQVTTSFSFVIISNYLVRSRQSTELLLFFADLGISARKFSWYLVNNNGRWRGKWISRNNLTRDGRNSCNMLKRMCWRTISFCISRRKIVRFSEKALKSSAGKLYLKEITNPGIGIFGIKYNNIKLGLLSVVVFFTFLLAESSERPLNGLQDDPDK